MIAYCACGHVETMHGTEGCEGVAEYAFNGSGRCWCDKRPARPAAYTYARRLWRPWHLVSATGNAACGAGRGPWDETAEQLGSLNSDDTSAVVCIACLRLVSPAETPRGLR